MDDFLDQLRAAFENPFAGTWDATDAALIFGGILIVTMLYRRLLEE